MYGRGRFFRGGRGNFRGGFQQNARWGAQSNVKAQNLQVLSKAQKNKERYVVEQKKSCCLKTSFCTAWSVVCGNTTMTRDFSKLCYHKKNKLKASRFLNLTITRNNCVSFFKHFGSATSVHSVAKTFSTFDLSFSWSFSDTNYHLECIKKQNKYILWFNW